MGRLATCLTKQAVCGLLTNKDEPFASFEHEWT